MKIETKFSPGDKIWVVLLGRGGGVKNVTVGKIEVSIVDSPGIDGEDVFDNYKSQSSYTERYMCVETGVGSGTVYTLGKTAFATKEEADERMRNEANHERT